MSENASIQYQQEFVWLEYALLLAKRARDQGEVPVGAVLVSQNKIIGEGWNQSISQNDPTAHAEIMALRQAGQYLKNYRMLGTTLYTTLEPCAMCAGALIHARIDRLVYGAADPKTGAVKSVFSLLNNPMLNHQIEVLEGIHKDSCSALLKEFFQTRRK